MRRIGVSMEGEVVVEVFGDGLLSARQVGSGQCFYYPFGISTILPITPPLPSNSCACRA
jgi:hypothetical protein